MFRLHKLEISGFKSFPDTVTIEFAEGITAIVGPNGCGKSNLSEAITWVLGEQSAKSLRGGKMEDVIFSGTERRKPLGMAEVSLTLATDEEHADAIEGKITIGRRVFRSGESLYRLNDRVTRLKDIRDLLMDTGLGIKAYSVIEQGKIGQILSSKPLERRKLLEEAAGISRYRQRKRLAELKLEEATANRMRLDDILAEVERALRTLKRQSNAARRYQERNQERREVLRKVLVLRGHSVRQRLTELEGALAAASDDDLRESSELARAEAQLVAARQRVDELLRQLADRQTVASELRARIEGRQEFTRGARQLLGETRERLDKGAATAQQRTQELANYSRAIEQLEASHEALLGERSGARAAVEERARKLADAAHALVEVERQQEELRSQMMASLGAVNGTQSRHHRAQIDEEKARYRRDHLQADLADKDLELARLAAELEAATLKVGEVAAAIDSKDAEHQGARAELEATLQQEAESSRRIQEARSELRDLSQRRKLLDELEAADEERREHLKRLLRELDIEEPSFLADLAHAPAGWEESVDLYLDQLHDAIVVPEGCDSLSLARALADQGAEATLLRATDAAIPLDSYALSLRSTRVPREQPTPPAPRARQETSQPAPRRGFLHRLAARLGLRNGGAVAPPPSITLADQPPPEPNPTEALSDSSGGAERNHAARSLGAAIGLPGALARALPPAYLVATAAEAERLASAHPGVAFLAQERCWAMGGVLRSQGAAARPGALTRSRELAEIEERIPALEHSIAESTAESERLVALRTELAKQANALEKALNELRQQHAVAAARRQDQANRHQRGQQERAELAQDLTAVVSEIERIVADQKALQQELSTAQQRHAELEQRFDQLQHQVEEAKTRREALRTEEASHKGQLKLVEQKVENSVLETQRLWRQTDQVRRHLADWKKEETELRERTEGLERQISEAETELQSALENRALADDAARALDQQVQTERAVVAERESSVAALREAKDARRSRIEELRIERATHEQEASHALLAFREEFREEPPALAALELTPDDTLELLEPRLAELKDTLERMGPVNVLAAQEYEEQEERSQFLTAQRADVQSSIDSLRRTIREINETSQERFTATFQQVNEAFATIFDKLFSGGEASMRLLDEEDALESGIEIVARPPGKRLQNIQLLSGGEKAMTAVALLFALFQTKPSPFCILDEVDAPLDDTNVLRFVNLVRSMTQQTQFLIVTHNKLTMEVASTLYGVTMEEKGVTTLVGVDIDALHPRQQLAS